MICFLLYVWIMFGYVAQREEADVYGSPVWIDAAIWPYLLGKIIAAKVNR